MLPCFFRLSSTVDDSGSNVASALSLSLSLSLSLIKIYTDAFQHMHAIYHMNNTVVRIIILSRSNDEWTCVRVVCICTISCHNGTGGNKT